jgi:DNA-binding IclR family transcriptional regulator
MLLSAQHHSMTVRSASPARRATVGSVEKAVSLLKILGDGAPEAGVSELARRLKVHKSTVSRLLATLERQGLVERNPDTEKYRLGFELVRLAGRVPRHGELVETARPALEALSQAAGETINLALPDGEQVINIYQISSRHLVKDTNWAGRRTPYHCTANGKALLAWLPEVEALRRLPARLQSFTASTRTSRAGLLKDLAEAREQGFAVAREELEIGLIAIAAPVRGANGEVVAAVSVSGPAYRLTPDRVTELGRQTARAAEEVSTRIGWSGERRA